MTPQVHQLLLTLARRHGKLYREGMALAALGDDGQRLSIEFFLSESGRSDRQRQTARTAFCQARDTEIPREKPHQCALLPASGMSG